MYWPTDMPTDRGAGWFPWRTEHPAPHGAASLTLRPETEAATRTTLTQRVDALDEAIASAGRRITQLMEELDLDKETGMQTRTAFLRGVARMRSDLPAQGGEDHALLHIWVPDLGAIALRHGGGAGILLASRVAHQLQAMLREGDLAGRLASDEFAAVLRHVTPAVALARLHGLKEHAGAEVFSHAGETIRYHLRGGAIELRADPTIAGLLERVAARTHCAAHHIAAVRRA